MLVDLWCAGVEHRNGGRWLRWRSCGLLPMDREWWRASAGSRLTDQSSQVTNRGDWHLGHALVRGRGGVDRVAGVSRTGGTRVWSWRTCTRCGVHDRFGGLGLKTTQRYKCLVLLTLGLKTRRWRFRRELVAARGVIAEGASRRSNSVWRTWPSDRKPRSWSISPPVELIGLCK
jgi:hypothetical protein